MCIKIYIAPSTNNKKVGIKEFGSEEYRCRQIADVVEYELSKIEEFKIKRNKYRFDYLSELADDSNKFFGKEDRGYYISIHTNLSKKQGVGAYYNKEKEDKKSSYLVAKSITEEMGRMYPRKDMIHEVENGDTISAELSMNNNKACIIEIGNIKNMLDSMYIINNIEEIGIAIVKGIIIACNDEFNMNIVYPLETKNCKEENKKDRKNNEIELNYDIKIEELESRVSVIEEKLEGLAEYLRIKRIDINKLTEDIAKRLEITTINKKIKK